MPLSPQDKAYWSEKLGWKAFAYLSLCTIIIGCVMEPLVLLTMDWSAGHGSGWTWGSLFDVAGANFFLALLVSTIIWCIGRGYLYMEWLPSRR